MKETILVLLCTVALAHGHDTTLSYDGDKCANCDPSKATQICRDNYDKADVLVAHEFCNKFYKCSNGKPYSYDCPSNLLYDPVKEECNWPHLVKCRDRLITEPDNEDEKDSSNNGDDNNNDIVCVGNCDPSEATSICSAKGSDGILIAHENCNEYYICVNSKHIARLCPPSLFFNTKTYQCDWADNVDCGNRIIPNPDDVRTKNKSDIDDNIVNRNGNCTCNPAEAPSICAAPDSHGTVIAHEKCNKYYICDNGKPAELSCPKGTFYNPCKEACDWPSNVECGDREIPQANDNDNNDNIDNASGENNGSGTCNCNPEDAPSICASSDSNNTLIAHEECNKYYSDNGRPVELPCPKDTFYNPHKEACDWPSNVECGDREIPQPDETDSSDNGSNGNDGTCNCNPGEAPSICAGSNSNSTLIAHEKCNKYYICDNGRPVELPCPKGTFYNPYKEVCDWPSNVECGDREMPQPNETDSSNNGSNDNGGTCNCNPGEAPSICAGSNSNSTLIAHEKCNKYYICDNGRPVELPCPKGTFYNPYKEECDWPSNVECGDREIPQPDETDSSDNGSNGNGGTCNCNPGEAPSICAGPNSNSTLIAHAKCNKYYICDNGRPVELPCPKGTSYNPYKEVCDWPSNVECGDREIPQPDDNDNNDNNTNDNGGTCNCNPGEAPSICAGSNSNSTLIAHEKCNKYYICDNDRPVELPCPKGTFYNPYKEVCDWPSNVECGDREIPQPDETDSSNNGSNDNGGTCNCNPGEAPSICAGSNSNSTLIAHEKCNKYYICDNGRPVELPCPKGTFYNPYKEECDWPSNVECGDREIPQPDETDSSDNGSNGNGGTCNCNPGEAPSICAGPNSNSTLIAHAKCNKYYICDNGRPVELPCPKGTFYNPYKEVCDWPSNVECGDREIPQPDDNDNNDNNTNDNGGTCNCNPGEAPSICAGSNSNSTLIAHEKCNKYYICDNGRPVQLPCPKGTFYNPYKEVCDWPSNVECGDREIPQPDETDSSDNGSNGNGGTCNCNPGEAPSICAGPNSNSTLIAHEKCNKYYICDNGRPVELPCPKGTFYNPYKEVCDWPSNVQCGDREIPQPDDNENNDNIENGSGENDSDGTCNCNPKEAPFICAGPDSNSILIAHEECNKYYICDNGRPVELPCLDGTFYNPYKEICDWPNVVECGDRIRPQPEECSCNPRNAPTLCAKENSDGRFITHENCNQFYVCVHGQPLPSFCPPGLLYNIEKEECDWPRNVDCSSRTVSSYLSHNKHKTYNTIQHKIIGRF